MSERRLTDAWGDRWDVVQEGTFDDNANVTAPLRFRHQAGREVIVEADQRMEALSDAALLERLDAALQREGSDHSVTRGIDAKVDPEGYTNPEDPLGAP